MRRYLLCLFLFLSSKIIWSQSANDWLQLSNTNHKLLNELLWDGINDMRIQKGIAPLEKNNHLVGKLIAYLITDFMKAKTE